MRIQRLIAVTAAVVLLAACGDEDSAAGDEASADRPTIVVSTSILGDVVSELVGARADVITIMPPGASPHDFQASARQADEMRRADALVVNGAAFEEGLLDVIEAAERDGVPVHEAIEPVDPIERSGGDPHGDDEHEDAHEEQHDDEGAHGDDGHDDSGQDPHFFTDPARMAVAAEGIVEFLGAEVDGLDADALGETAQAYLDELQALDAEVEAVLAPVPEHSRVLVTNHEVFGYFAERYDFEVIGTVIPGGSTSDAASARDLAGLAAVIEDEGVPAVFADTSSADDLARTLAAEVGDVEVVELFSESLGEDGSGGETYLEMMRTNAERIAEALT